jgi:hypothetical protein
MAEDEVAGGYALSEGRFKTNYEEKCTHENDS